MKLSPYIENIEQAYQALLLEINLSTTRPEFAFNYSPRRLAHVLPRNRADPTPPHLAPDYHPNAPDIPFQNKERLVLLAAFEATYHDTYTPLTPDMVPVIIDTGASISISPYATDFVDEIKPVQNVTLKGIASGLNIAGIGTIQYRFTNDATETQTITLEHCLHVPQCTVRLLCPPQIGVTTSNTATSPIFTVNGKITTLQYDTTSNLPLLFTSPGITNFQLPCKIF